MVKYGELDPHAGFGGKFYDWLFNPRKLWPDGVRHPYNSAIRLAISLGGDADTQACIAGGIAEAFYGMPDALVEDIGYHLLPVFKTNIIRLAENSAYVYCRDQLRRCWRK